MGLLNIEYMQSEKNWEEFSIINFVGLSYFHR